MKARSVLVLAVGLGLLLLGARWLWSPDASNPDAANAAEAATNENEVSTSRSELRDGTRPAGHALMASPSPQDRGDARKALAQAIARARAKREASDSEAHGNKVHNTGDESGPRPLNIANKTGSNTEWEQRQLELLSELLGECYDLAAHEQPGLAGTIGIRFAVAAEPNIGGLVDGVEFMGEYSSIDHPGMRECMHESMYALELDPPPEGIMVERQITLRFDAEDSN